MLGAQWWLKESSLPGHARPWSSDSGSPEGSGPEWGRGERSTGRMVRAGIKEASLEGFSACPPRPLNLPFTFLL